MVSGSNALILEFYLFSNLGLIIYKYKKLVILLWALLFISSSIVAPRVFDQLVSGGFDIKGTESARAAELIEEMGLAQSTIDIVFQRNDYSMSQDVFFQQIEQATFELDSIDQISSILIPGKTNEMSISKDKDTVIVTLWIDGSLDDAQRLVPIVRNYISDEQGIKSYVTGFASVFYDVEIASKKDLIKGEIISLPLVLLALVLIFGALYSSFVPLIAGMVAIGITTGLIFVFSSFIEMSVFSLNIATFLGLGAAVDYSLLLVSRFREELENSNTQESIIKTVSTAGRAIFFSAFTTCLGLSGLLFFNITMLRSIAIGGIAVIIVSALLSFTLTPALLSILGSRINKYRIPIKKSFSQVNFWRTISNFVMRRSLIISVPILILLVIAGLPFQRINLGSPSADLLPPAYESRQGTEIISRAFGEGHSDPIIIAVQASNGSIKGQEEIEALKLFTNKIIEDPRVKSVYSIVDFDPDMEIEGYINFYKNFALLPDNPLKESILSMSSEGITYITVIANFKGTDPRAKELVQDIRAYQPRGPILESFTTGFTAGTIDSIEFLYSRFPMAIALVILGILGALFLSFRSILLPIKAVIMNALSILASLGALVVIFQDGRLEAITGIQSTGQIESTIPILLFFVLFGISMDYEVFLLSRIQERYSDSGDNDLAVTEGLIKTGPVITNAAIIFILVGVGFAAGDLTLIRIWAVGLIIGVALDVTVVRSIMVPALMKIFGDWNWWAPRIFK